MGLQPACGEQRAIELTERIRPILDALFPTWETEVSVHGMDPWGQPREACQMLLGGIASHSEIGELLAGHDASPRLSAAGFHEQVWTAASAQWKTGHRHEAVLAAAKAVNSMLQAKVGRRDVSDVKLVQEAFGSGSATPDRPRLRFPQIDDEQTRESVTQGALSFGVGCFQAIRNPVGHLPNKEIEISDQDALERLAALSLFARWIDDARVTTA